MSEFFWFVVCIAIVIVGTNFETLQKLRNERKGNKRDREFKINWIRNHWYNPYKKHLPKEITPEELEEEKEIRKSENQGFSVVLVLVLVIVLMVYFWVG